MIIATAIPIQWVAKISNVVVSFRKIEKVIFNNKKK
jgi:hypothetical protein